GRLGVAGEVAVEILDGVGVGHAAMVTHWHSARRCPDRLPAETCQSDAAATTPSARLATLQASGVSAENACNHVESHPGGRKSTSPQLRSPGGTICFLGP